MWYRAGSLAGALLLVAAIVCIVHAVQAVSVVFVSHDGTDGSDCGASTAAPCRTVAFASTLLSDGATLAIAEAVAPYDCGATLQNLNNIRVTPYIPFSNVSATVVSSTASVSSTATPSVTGANLKGARPNDASASSVSPSPSPSPSSTLPPPPPPTPAVVFDCAGAGRAFRVVGGQVTFVSITFAHGRAPVGGAIMATQANVTFSNCTFQSNAATATAPVSGALGVGGGAIYAETSAVLVKACTFANNTATNGGAVLVVDGPSVACTQPRIFNSTFTGNAADGSGGAVAVMGVVSSGKGPSIVGDKCVSRAEVDRCLFANNTVETGYGGAIAASFEGAAPDQVRLANSAFQFNTAGDDGGGGAVSVRFTKSTTSSSGDGALVHFALNTFTSNAIVVAGPSSIALGSGGALYVEFGSASKSGYFTNCTANVFSYNTAFMSGGAVAIVHTGAVAGVRHVLAGNAFTGNSVDTGDLGSEMGGAVSFSYLEAATRVLHAVENNAFLRNFVGGYSPFGGALGFLYSHAGTGTTDDCLHALDMNTFTANGVATSDKYAAGGAVGLSIEQASRNMSLTITGSTFSSNSAACPPVGACDAAGGAVLVDASECDECGIFVASTSFSNNYVNGSSGGEAFGGAVAFSLVMGNSAALNVSSSSFSNNFAFGNASLARGGGVAFRCGDFSDESRVQFGSTTFTSNVAAGAEEASGGAIYTEHVIGSMGSSLLLTGCTLNSNMATASGPAGKANGGALYVSHASGVNSIVAVVGTGFSDNVALSTGDAGGGAVAWVSGDLFGPRNSVLSIDTSQFSRNRVGVPASTALKGTSSPTKAFGGAVLAAYHRATSCSHRITGSTFTSNYIYGHIEAQGGAFAVWKDGDAGMMTTIVAGASFVGNYVMDCDVCLGGAVSGYTGRNASFATFNLTDSTLSKNVIKSDNPVNPLDVRVRHRCAGGAVSFLNEGSCQGSTIVSLRNVFDSNGISCGSFSYGGAVSILHANGTQGNRMIFQQNAFQSNFAATNQSGYGGALSVVFGSAGPSYSCGSNTINLRANNFDSNLIRKLQVNATAGLSYAALGGAVCIIGCPDDMDPSTVGRGTFVRWQYKTTTKSSDDTFTDNEAGCVGCSGGAFHATNGNSSFARAVFAFNVGGSYGGAINTDGNSAGLTLVDSVLGGNDASRGGRELYAGGGGDLTVRNTSFVASQPSQSFFEVPYGGRLSIDNASVLACPAGSQLTMSTLDPYITADPLGVYVNLVTSSVYGCLACPRNYYGLDGGYWKGAIVRPAECIVCPVGAECPDGGSSVQSLAGYWCGSVTTPSQDGEFLVCYACPEGYCCAGDSCDWQAPCIGNRTGTLCGSCREGYGELLGSLECESVDSCNGGYWIVVLVSAVVSLIIIGLLVGLPIASTALWKSFWYFVQMLPLVLDTQALRFAGGHLWSIFTFEPNIGGYTVCPYSGMSTVARIAMGYTVPVVAMGLVALLWVAHFLLVRRGLREDFDSYVDFESLIKFDQRVYRAMESADSDGFASFPLPRVSYLNTKRSGRFARTMMGIALLAYLRVALTTFNLVSCTRVFGSDRLFLEGDLHCGGHWWQSLAFFLIGAVLIPVPAALAYLRYCAHKDGARPTWSTRWAVGVLEGPFVPSRWWWEVVILYRRIVLAAMRVFISDPYWRSLALALGCLAVFGLNVYAAPFANANAQRVENSFLFGLALIALLACRDGAYASFGVPGGGRMGESASRSIANVEIALAIAPMAITLLVVLARLFWACTWVREVNWPLTRFHKSFGPKDAPPSPSGVPDDEYDSDGSGNTTPFHRTGSMVDGSMGERVSLLKKQ